MIFVLSPAKTLDFATPPCTARHSQPSYLQESALLMKELRPLTLGEVARLLGLSEELAALNAGRFQQWRTPFTPRNAKQAVLAFNGDVYGGLDARSLDEADLAFAQDHLRILSGLYGLLRPLDLIQPYRLEMGTRLPNPRGKDLYAFWRERLTRDLARDLAREGEAPLLLNVAGGVLVNLASEEYFKALDPKGLQARIITPVFQDWKNGTYKVISFFAKRARGLFCREAIRRRLQEPESMKDFSIEGYAFDLEASAGDRWVFRRKVL